MNKIKETLSSIWGWVAAITVAAWAADIMAVVVALGRASHLAAVAVVGIMLYIIQAKQKRINALNAKAELADTQKKADLVEVEIKQHLQQNATLDKEIKELNKSLDLLAQKRKDISASEKNKTSDEVEDFWKKN